MKTNKGIFIFFSGDASFVANIYYGYQVVANTIVVDYLQILDQHGHAKTAEDLAYEAKNWVREQHMDNNVDFECKIELL